MMTEEEKRIYTIDDIARELGVSKTTVSRVPEGLLKLPNDMRMMLKFCSRF